MELYLRRGIIAWLAIGLIVVLVGGCATNSAPAGNQGAKPGSDGKQQVKVALVTATGGLGDRSFNDSAWAGFQRAEKELGAGIKVVEPTSVADYATQLSAMADAGYQLVVGIGFDMKDAVAKVAPKYPNTKFATVNVMVDAPNVAVAQFKDHEGSFLAGALAGAMTKTGVVGFVGGADAPNIRRFLVGYEEGVKATNPNAKVLPAFVGAFNDPAKGKESTLQLIAQKADIIFHAAGKTGEGVIDAAKQSNVYAIGVDQDQDFIAPGRVLTSMVKRVDVAMYDLIKSVKDGNFKAGVHMYGLKEGGVGLSEMKYTKDAIPRDVLTKIDDLKSKIISGEIKVTDVFEKK